MSLFLGVDAGNTKTIALVADERGKIVGAGRSGNGDIYGAVTAEAALQAHKGAVEQALANAGAGRAEAGGFSVAGADWPEDYEFIEAFYRSQGWTGKIKLVNDSMGALAAGSSNGHGVAVICGTYGTCGARGPGGKEWQGGFWHDAHGGAIPIGRTVLSALLDRELGIGKETTLTQRALAHFGKKSVEELLHTLTYRGHSGWGGIDGLTRITLEEAAKGDEVATQIIARHGERAAAYAVAAASLVELDGAFDLVLTGGVLRSAPNPLSAAIIRSVQEKRPEVRPVPAELEPVFGALLLGYQAGGVEGLTELRRSLKENAPMASLFKA